VLVAEGRQSDRTVARRFCAALTIRIGADMAALALPVEGVRRSAQGKARGGNSSRAGCACPPLGRARGWTVTTSRLYGGGDPARSQAAVIAPGSERAKPALHTPWLSEIRGAKARKRQCERVRLRSLMTVQAPTIRQQHVVERPQRRRRRGSEDFCTSTNSRLGLSHPNAQLRPFATRYRTRPHSSTPCASAKIRPRRRRERRAPGDLSVPPRPRTLPSHLQRASCTPGR
jgi:hypothetical protein